MCLAFFFFFRKKNGSGKELKKWEKELFINLDSGAE